MIAKLQRARQVLKHRGLGYGFYVLRGVVAPRIARAVGRRMTGRRVLLLALVGIPTAFSLFALLLGAGVAQAAWLAAIVFLLVTALAVIGRPLWRTWRLRRWLAEAKALAAAAEPASSNSSSVTWDSWKVSDTTRRAVDSAEPDSDGDLLLGRIERDGLLATDLGEFPGFETVPAEAFRPRDRFDLDLVLRNHEPLIRKDFRGDSDSFAREWLALERLRDQARVPRIARALPDRLRLYRTLVPGRPLNDLLVAAGAQIRESQIESAPDAGDRAALETLDSTNRIETILARGRAVLERAVPETFFAALEWELDRIHEHGVTGLSLTFGNVTVDSDDRPWLFDFDRARIHSSTANAFFEVARDRDRIKYNQIYGRSIVTEASARAVLRPLDGGYSPVDLGRGLVTRGFWSIDSGTGRWDYLNGPALSSRLQGRRVLDLGSNNGTMPIMMLRSGARAVVGLEQDPELIAQARNLLRLAEWRDFTRYNLEVQAGDMRVILDDSAADRWTGFDIVTAFCSLYYLNADEMAQMVRRAAEIAPLLILQAKTDTQPGPDGKAERSSVDFQRRLLEDNGFSRVEVIAPEDFTRPLLIAHRDVGAVEIQ